MIRDPKTGKWLDSSVFRQEGLKFQRVGYYTNSPKNTPEWFEYWDEQLDRCIKGYSVFDSEGREHKITQHHYMYLNFSTIQIAVPSKDGSQVASKQDRPPDFWDGDYNYFWSLEIARNGLFTENSLVPSTQEERETYRYYQEEIRKLRKEKGRVYKGTEEYATLKKKRDAVSIEVLDRLGLYVRPHLDFLDGGHHFIVGKSRRKGYSYKNAAICANVYNTIKNAQIIIGAFEKKFLYPQGTMGMASTYLNFINSNTAWSKSRDEVDKIDHKKASYKTVVNGVTVIRGYQSEIFALTFKDNPDAARGKDGYIVLLEESGAFPILKEAYNAIAPALTAGSYITGQIIIFGTGGDMESGTVDYADMFYHPEAHNLMPFYNIWDEGAESTVCGFFHPVTWNMEGYYDEQGNSDIEGAIEFEMERRADILAASSSPTTLQRHVQEFSLRPSEAFLTVSTNTFPIVELRNQLNKVITERLQFKKGTPVFLERQEGKVTARPDIRGELNPIYDYKYKNTDLKGAVVIYEYPIDNPPKGLYKVGYDPYAQDKGTSLSSITVYKSFHSYSYTKNVIVAEYVGRPFEADDANRIAYMLAELYNTEVMHENMVGHVKNFFRRIKALNRLAAQPDAVISKSIKNSKVARVYGIHMVEEIKGDGEKYIKDWLMEIADYDENDNPIYNLDNIYSIGLLEELIAYDRKKGNYDRVMSLMMCMFQVQEEKLGKDYAENKGNKKIAEIMDALDKYYNVNYDEQFI